MEEEEGWGAQEDGGQAENKNRSLTQVTEKIGDSCDGGGGGFLPRLLPPQPPA